MSNSEVHHARQTTQRGADEQDDGRRHHTKISRLSTPLRNSLLTQHSSSTDRTAQVWRPAAGAKPAAAVDQEKGIRAARGGG
jgi:hypothetical protein